VKCKVAIQAAKSVTDAGSKLHALLDDDKNCAALRTAAVKCQVDANAAAASDVTKTAARVTIDSKCVTDPMQLAAAKACWDSLTTRRKTLVDAAKMDLKDADCLRPRKCVPFDGERRRFVLHQIGNKDETPEDLLNRVRGVIETRINRKQNDGTEMGDQTPTDVETKTDGTVVKRDPRANLKRTWANLVDVKNCIEARLEGVTTNADDATTVDCKVSLGVAKDCLNQQMTMTRKRATNAQIAADLDTMLLDVATAVEVSKEPSDAPVDESVPTDEYQGYEVSGTSTKPSVDNATKAHAATVIMSSLAVVASIVMMV